MTSQYDCYKEVEELIDMLNDTQLQIHSDSLRFAMDEGATGTEIFMALRFNLEKLLNQRQCTNLVRLKAQRLWEHLDKALQ